MLLIVARQGSFAAAARALDADPSRVSRTIAGLEAELGFRLFERSTRHIAPTTAGASYMARIEPLVDEFLQAGEVARGEVQAVSGEVRLTASVAFGTEILVPILPEIEARLPDIELELILTDAPVDLIGAGIDLAIRLAPSPSGDFISTRLMRTQYRVVAAPKWVDAHPNIVEPAQLEGVRCLRYALPSFPNEWTFRRKGVLTGVKIEGAFSISNALALRQAARDGMGPALLADWLLHKDLTEGDLVGLFPDYDATATGFDTGAWLLYPSRRYLPRRVRVMIDILRRLIPGR